MTTQTATTIEQRGARLYLVGLPFAQKDAAKAALGLTGANFDRDARQWWCGAAKRAAAEAFVAALNATPLAPAAAPAAGGPALNKEDPDKVRVVAKVKYKGRTYFARWIGEGNGGLKAHLFNLDGSNFWGLMNRPGESFPDRGTVEKIYQPREVRGRYGRGAGREEYQTLGAIARFIERQKNPETARVQCPECGSWRNQNEKCRDCGGC